MIGREGEENRERLFFSSFMTYGIESVVVLRVVVRIVVVVVVVVVARSMAFTRK